MQKRNSLVVFGMVAVMMVAFGRASYAQNQPPQPAQPNLDQAIATLTTAVTALKDAISNMPANQQALIDAYTQQAQETQMKLDEMIALQAARDAAAAAAAAAAQPVPPVPMPTGADDGSSVWGDPSEVPRFVQGGTNFGFTNVDTSHYRCVEETAGTVDRTHWYLGEESVVQEQGSGNGEGNLQIRARKKKSAPVKPGRLVRFRVESGKVTVVQILEATEQGKKPGQPLGDVTFDQDGNPTLYPYSQDDETAALEEAQKVADAFKDMGDDIAKSSRSEQLGSSTAQSGAATGKFNFVESDAVKAFNRYTWTK